MCKDRMCKHHKINMYEGFPAWGMGMFTRTCIIRLAPRAVADTFASSISARSRKPQSSEVTVCRCACVRGRGRRCVRMLWGWLAERPKQTGGRGSLGWVCRVDCRTLICGAAAKYDRPMDYTGCM